KPHKRTVAQSFSRIFAGRDGLTDPEKIPENAKESYGPRNPRRSTANHWIHGSWIIRMTRLHDGCLSAGRDDDEVGDGSQRDAGEDAPHGDGPRPQFPPDVQQ